MSLIPLIEPGAGDEAQNDFLSQVPPLNLFKALANAAHVALPTAQFGGVLLFGTALDPLVREAAILRLAHRVGNDYEVGHHERIGRDLGMSEAQLAALRAGGEDDGVLSPGQALAARWAEAVVAGHKAPPALVAEALDLLGPGQSVELSMTIGYYLMVAIFLESFAIPFEGAGFDDGVKVR